MHDLSDVLYDRSPIAEILATIVYVLGTWVNVYVASFAFWEALVYLIVIDDKAIWFDPTLAHAADWRRLGLLTLLRLLGVIQNFFDYLVCGFRKQRRIIFLNALHRNELIHSV